MAGPASWARLHPAARWLFAYAFALGLFAALGASTPVGVGNAVFVGGALAIFASLSFVRLGGPKARVGRDLRGRAIFDVDAQARREEIRKGLALFFLGVAMWAALGVGALVA